MARGLKQRDSPGWPGAMSKLLPLVTHQAEQRGRTHYRCWGGKSAGQTVGSWSGPRAVRIRKTRSKYKGLEDIQGQAGPHTLVRNVGLSCGRTSCSSGAGSTVTCAGLHGSQAKGWDFPSAASFPGALETTSMVPVLFRQGTTNINQNK